MMMKSIFALVLMSAAATGLVAEGLRSGMVRLKGSTEINGTTIRLSDLLPADAPRDVRKSAEEMAIAHAPEPGIIRFLKSREILASLAGNDPLLKRLDIPEVVAVSRRSRMLTPAEVAALLQPVRPHVIDLAGMRLPQVPVAEEAHLIVAGVRYDQHADKSYVRLELSSDADSSSGITQLLATIRGQLRANSEVAPSLEQERGKRIAEDAIQPSNAATTPLIVWAGRKTLAYIELPGIRITQFVLPLRNGRLGETIAVRNFGTRKTMTALVTGESRLQLLPSNSQPLEVKSEK